MTSMALAVDMGGSHITCGVVRLDGIVAQRTVSLPQPVLQNALPLIEAALFDLVQATNTDLRDFSGLAIGICAIADPGCGEVLATNGKFEDAKGFRFSEWAKRRFNLPVRIENDARLALLGEHAAGAAKDAKDVVLVTIGTGIGGAVLLNGRLLRSQGAKAGGLIGHLCVDFNGHLCSCGNRGCAEAEASTWSLDSLCREQPEFALSSLARMQSIHFQALFTAVDEGDSLASKILDHCCRVWSALTVSLIHAYDPELIVFGGGVMNREQDILPRIREYVRRHAWAPEDSVRIRPSALGSSAALHGALPLLKEKS